MNMLSLGLLLALSFVFAVSEVRGGTFFQEEFLEVAISEPKWRVEDVVGGPRWCGPVPGSPGAPGEWINPEVEHCFGLLAPPPHGSASVAVGLLQMSAAASSRSFPYLATRRPDGLLPFPPTGDFVFRTRLRYDAMAQCGVGVFVVDWDDTTPNSNNASILGANFVLQIWGDGAGLRLFTGLRGSVEQLPASISGPLAFHEYTVTHANGVYQILVDGAVVFGPVPSPLRPAAIWIGNPILSWVGPCSGWSALSVDYVRVEADAATAAAITTMGALKALYRDAWDDE